MLKQILQHNLRARGDLAIENVRRLFEEDAVPDEENELDPFHPFRRKRDWSRLTSDICMLIAERVTFRPHLDKFASSCKEWLLASRDVSSPPFMLLPFNDKYNTCRFVDLSDDTNINDLEMLDQECCSSICGCSNGWLALTTCNLEVVLFNPWTRTQIALPRLPADQRTNWACIRCHFWIYTSRPHIFRMNVVWKLAISGDPHDHLKSSATTNSCLVAVILRHDFRLAICRLGDEDWTLNPTVQKYHIHLYQYFRDVIFHKGKIYANTNNCLYEMKYHGPGDIKIKKIPIPYDVLCDTMGGTYLASSCEDILFIERYEGDEDTSCDRTDRFVVYRLERATEEWKIVDNLGGRTLFLGWSSSVSVSAEEFRFQWCKPDCIYYLEDEIANFERQREGYQRDNGIFSVKENKFVRTSDIQHSSFWPSPALWYL